MNKKLIRNVFWIALVAVWSFLAGAYLYLGWMRKAPMSYEEGFIIGGLGVWIVFAGMGILIYRFAKNGGSSDPAKPALGVVSFFTVCFLLLSWIKYDEVKNDKFVKDIEGSFIDYYEEKAIEKQLKIENLNDELRELYWEISYDLENHPQLDELMELKTAEAVFEENPIIEELCIESIKISKKYGYPPPKGMEKLFE